MFTPPTVLEAGTCTAQNSCPLPPLQVTPGQIVRVEVVNRTSILIEMEQLYATGPVALYPGDTYPFLSGSTIHNFSLIFWDPNGGRLLANVSQPEERLLRIEILPGGQIEGQGAVYLRNDGRVEVF